MLLREYLPVFFCSQIFLKFLFLPFINSKIECILLLLHFNRKVVGYFFVKKRQVYSDF
jgi:hypothetical protein